MPSLIAELTREELETIIKDATSLNDALVKIGYRATGNHSGPRKQLQARIDEEKHATDHFTLPRGRSWKTIPLAEILVEKSTYGNGQDIRKKLIAAELIKDECAMCQIGTDWHGHKLCLQLDHINGTHNDNRLENLRLLCPNCHSCTDTFCGKNKPKRVKKVKFTKIAFINTCTDCDREISYKGHEISAVRCKSCTAKLRAHRKVRPSKEQMTEDLETMSYCAVGRKYGVSDNTIRNWLKSD